MMYEDILIFADDPATSGNAGSIVVLPDYDFATSGNASYVSYPVQAVGQDAAGMEFEASVLSDLDALVGIGTYLLAFMLFLVVLVLIRSVYRFIRIFI